MSLACLRADSGRNAQESNSGPPRSVALYTTMVPLRTLLQPVSQKYDQNSVFVHTKYIP